MTQFNVANLRKVISSICHKKGLAEEDDYTPVASFMNHSERVAQRHYVIDPLADQKKLDFSKWSWGLIKGVADACKDLSIEQCDKHAAPLPDVTLLDQSTADERTADLDTPATDLDPVETPIGREKTKDDWINTHATKPPTSKSPARNQRNQSPPLPASTRDVSPPRAPVAVTSSGIRVIQSTIGSITIKKDLKKSLRKALRSRTIEELRDKIPLFATLSE